MGGGVAAWLILAQQQRGGSAEAPDCFTYAGGGLASYAGAGPFTYAGDDDADVTYGGACG